MKRVLVANRGEIALRVFRTCRRLGLNTVAIYSTVDSSSPHARAADQAAMLKGATIEETYLNIEQIIAIAKTYRVDAIHPGYGFLSENAEFSAAVAAAGLIFIGPSPETLRTFGKKDCARQAAVACAIPVVPGCQDIPSSPSELRKVAEKIGFPLMIKAVGGGGGKGMRRVQNLDELEPALLSAGREAKSFFKDPTLLIEKVIEPARHIEVQLMADQHGNTIHLFERDCSMQRRFQKIIEESPARDISPELRNNICAAAVKIGRHVGLVGAATVEFLVESKDDQENFYFLEANPRLQVEHPVTELVTGLDLVELQLRAAAGQKLGLSQEEVKVSGCAVEARVYAEIAQQNFIPSGGIIKVLTLPTIHDHTLRIDHALEQGIEITSLFDPMLMKIITWGETNKQAWQNLQQALSHTVLIGVENNISFLLALTDETLRDPTPQSISAIERNRAVLCAPERYAQLISTAACLMGIGELQLSYPDTSESGTLCVAAIDAARDPFISNLHWRGVAAPAPLNELSSRFVIRAATISEVQSREVAITSAEWAPTNERYLAEVRGAGSLELVVLKRDKIYGMPQIISCNQEIYRVRFLSPRRNAYGQFESLIYLRGHLLDCRPTQDWEDPEQKFAASAKQIYAPLPGLVLTVKVKQGDFVKAGEPLLVIESMKTEHVISAPRDATIAELRTASGKSVKAGQVLAVLD